jgi:hypothetical protein
LNRCRGFCRPLPNHSATPPDHPSCRCERSVYPGMKRWPRNGPSCETTGFEPATPLGRVAGPRRDPHEPRPVSSVDLSAQRYANADRIRPRPASTKGRRWPSNRSASSCVSAAAIASAVVRAFGFGEVPSNRWSHRARKTSCSLAHRMLPTSMDRLGETCSLREDTCVGGRE